jgi:DNA polymerase III sliding clamp (beta) subunit (PCNA family)
MIVSKKHITRSLASLKKIKKTHSSNLNISTNNVGMVEFSGFDDQMYVCCGFPCSGTSDISSCNVDIGTFGKVVSAMGDDIGIDIREDNVCVSGDLSIDIGVMKPDETCFPTYEWEEVCHTKISDLFLVAPAISTDITRQHLMKAYVSSGIVVATDGHRLHLVGDYSNWDFNSSKGACIPSIAVDMLLSFGDDIVHVYSGKRIVNTRKDKEGKEIVDYEYAVKCATDRMLILAKLDDKDFLDFKLVIPENENSFVVNTDKLKKTLSAISNIHKSNDTVTMEVEGDSILLSCGMVKSSIKINSIDTQLLDFVLKCGFKCKYLIDALTNSKTTKIEVGSPLNPIMVTSGNLKAVIMPVRI